jgi:hypothetical protein
LEFTLHTRKTRPAKVAEPGDIPDRRRKRYSKFQRKYQVGQMFSFTLTGVPDKGMKKI